MHQSEMEKEFYEEEVQPYRKMDYKLMIYIRNTTLNAIILTGITNGFTNNLFGYHRFGRGCGNIIHQEHFCTKVLGFTDVMKNN